MDARTERRVVTCLFIDVVGSTDLMMSIGPEVMRRRLSAAFDEMSARIAEHGGTVEKFVGDAIFALFGAPSAHADDPERALRAAAACVDWSTGALRDRRLSVRVGIETGEALVDLSAVERQERMAIGACVNVAARLQQQADPGEILVGPDFHAVAASVGSFDPAGPMQLKGVGERDAWRFVGFDVRAAPHDVPFVGRERELGQLVDAGSKVIAGGRSNLALVVGAPGLGKTRLAHQALRQVGEQRDARPIEIRCRPAGEAGANSPLRQLVSALVPDGTVAGIAAFVSSTLRGGESASAAAAIAHSAGIAADPNLLAISRYEQRALIAEAWRRVLAGVATDRPVILLVEDVHWADPVLVRVIDHVTDDFDAPVFVVATARPEFVESAHLSPTERRVEIELEPLDEESSAALAAAVRGGVIGLERAAGNPLFIVELARARTSAADLPLTIQSAIAARLDELAPDDRQLLQHVSVAGDTFDVRDASLLDDRDAAEVAAMLGRIAHLGFITPVNARYRFHHALVRDVAYGRLPVGSRMPLHLRYAEHGTRPGDIEARAFHLWEATRPPDAEWVWEDATALANLRSRAFRAQLEAGKRLEARNQYEQAGDVYVRAVELATQPSETALARSELGRAHARQGRGDDAWRERKSALAAYREAQTDAPAQLYADMLELPTMNWGYFKELPPDSEVMTLLDEGERTARASTDDVSLARLLTERAAFTGDVSRLAEVARLTDSDEGVRFADPAQRAAMVLLSNGDIRGSCDLFRKVFDDLAPRGAIFNEPEALVWYGLAAFVAGDIALAQSIADRALADAQQGRSAHTYSHVYSLGALIAFGRGDWGHLADERRSLDDLIERSPDASFCLWTGAAIGYGGAQQLVRGEPLATDLRSLVARALEPFELVRAASVMLPEAMRGNAQAVDDGFAAYAKGLRLYDRFAVLDVCWLNPTMSNVVLRRWDKLEPVFARLDECATGGSRLAAAVATAVREERAASVAGGSTPEHVDLRALGYAGLSEILHYRAS
jgi:class 3 adenylate cyclase/tetratricopeptide (TPR) repeat protein